jgi:hypothetical protein
MPSRCTAAVGGEMGREGEKGDGRDRAPDGEEASVLWTTCYEL